MRHKKLSILFILLGQCLFLPAQNRPEWMNWYFGYGAGINFQGAVPAAVSGKVQTSEGSAVANGPQGELLFYTDGITVWNKLHVPMKNGTGLLGNSSSTQSALILAITKEKYFIFTADAVPGIKGYNYTEVDMAADGGLGAVVSNRKNMPISKPSTERMLLARSDDSLSYWLIIRVPYSSIFKSYRVNSQGLDTNAAVISNCAQTTDNTSGWGNMVISNKGDKIAALYANNRNVVLYDFDNKSGKLSNAKVINQIFAAEPTSDYYSVIFSPNDRYLYVSGYMANLKQVDTWEPLVSMGRNARKLSEKKLSNLGTLQYSPDGKSIYLSRTGNFFISSIPFPDLPAPACGFIDTAIRLSNRCALGLPAFVSGYLSWNPDFIPHDQCYGDSSFFEFKAGSFIPDSIRWDFGDSREIITYAPYSSLKHYYAKAGTYQVTMQGYHQGKVLSVLHTAQVYQKTFVEIGNDTIICKNDFVPFNLAATVGPGVYKWQNGSTAASYRVAGAGTYWVEIKNGRCADYDSVKVSLDSARFAVNLGPDSSYCDGEQVLLDAGYPGAAYRWHDQQSQQTYTATRTGVYHVEVKRPGLLCPAFDTVRLDFKPLPKLELGPEQVLCPEAVVKIDLQGKGYDQLLWQDGSMDSLYQVKTGGLYTLKVWSDLCSSTDSLLVKQVLKKDYGLPRQYKACKDEMLEVDLSVISGTLNWPDGLQAKKRSLDTEGWHWYHYSDSGCVQKDSFYIERILPPAHHLPRDTTVCPGESIWLQAATAGTCLWQDGSTDALYKVTEPGRYIVVMQNSCATVTDSIDVWDCSCILHVPTAFSPNEDGLNEEFKPVAGCEPEYYRLRIYNRWGEILFESNSFSKGWNGLYKGSPVTDNTLVWTIEYSSSTRSRSHNKMIKGTLSILH